MNPRRRATTAAALVLALTLGPNTAAQATPETLIGQAFVIDGDTLDIQGQRIRLHGIDAPESHQMCTYGGSEYPCGARAAEYLSSLIDHRTIQCLGEQRDKYGRLIARCYIDQLDLNAEMVRAGWAMAFRRFSLDYADLEDAAHAMQSGIWASTFEAPWDWRRDHH